MDRQETPLIGEDTVGSIGRNVDLHLDSGRVVVSALGRKSREI